MIERRMGIITDSLEDVVAKPVPAKLIALANAKKERTNNNPSPAPNINVCKENNFDSLNIKNVKAIKEAIR
jgi:hypothetical protein